jgi:hypothetical protein
MSAALLAVALTVGLAAGYILAVVRRPTTQDDHDRAVAEFAKTNRLQSATYALDPTCITVTLEGIRLRFVGTHPDGAAVYVNDEPLPEVDVVHIDGMPDDTTVVIVGGVR